MSREALTPRLTEAVKRSTGPLVSAKLTALLQKCDITTSTNLHHLPEDDLEEMVNMQIDGEESLLPEDQRTKEPFLAVRKKVLHGALKQLYESRASLVAAPAAPIIDSGDYSQSVRRNSMDTTNEAAAGADSSSGDLKRKRETERSNEAERGHPDMNEKKVMKTEDRPVLELTIDRRPKTRVLCNYCKAELGSMSFQQHNKTCPKTKKD